MGKLFGLRLVGGALGLRGGIGNPCMSKPIRAWAIASLFLLFATALVPVSAQAPNVAEYYSDGSGSLYLEGVGFDPFAPQTPEPDAVFQVVVPWSGGGGGGGSGWVEGVGKPSESVDQAGPILTEEEPIEFPPVLSTGFREQGVRLRVYFWLDLSGRGFWGKLIPQVVPPAVSVPLGTVDCDGAREPAQFALATAAFAMASAEIPLGRPLIEIGSEITGNFSNGSMTMVAGCQPRECLLGFCWANPTCTPSLILTGGTGEPINRTGACESSGGGQ